MHSFKEFSVCTTDIRIQIFEGLSLRYDKRQSFTYIRLTDEEIICDPDEKQCMYLIFLEVYYTFVDEINKIFFDKQRKIIIQDWNLENISVSSAFV